MPGCPVYQVDVWRQSQCWWRSFRVAALVLLGCRAGVFDRDVHGARVNYIAGLF